MKSISTIIFILTGTLISSRKDKVGILQGDVMIGALFQIYYGEDGECVDISETSVQALEAVKWTIQLLNEYKYIPGIRIGLVALPTCRIQSLANNGTFELIADMKYRYDSNCSRYLNSGPLAAIIGPEFSSEAQSTSTIVSLLPSNERPPQMGFSTTATVLSDKKLFKDFYRVIPADDIQVSVMVALMGEMKWNYISIIYEDDVYGRDATFQLKTLASKHDICVAAVFHLTVDSKKDARIIEISKILRNIITHKESRIDGVVIFGTATVGNTILETAENLPDTDEMKFIFSEGVELKESMFKSGRNIINLGKGSFVVSPKKLRFDNFSDYWRWLYTNISKLGLESKSNPWLIDVLEKYQSCVYAAGSCHAMLHSDINEKYEDALYTGYAVKAILVVVKALKDLYDDHCTASAPNTICSQYMDILSKEKYKFASKLSALMENFQINLPPPLNETYSQILHNLESNETSVTQMKTYHVYQFRSCLDNPGALCLVEVGNYENKELKLEKSLIQSYSILNQQQSWMGMKPAQCAADKVCSTCMYSNIADQIYFEYGDVYIVGIVPIYSKDRTTPTQCDAIRTSYSVEIAEGMAFAVKTSNANQFSGKKIGFIVLNSCNQALVIQNKILNLHNKGLQLPNGTFISVADKIVGYVGSYSSTISIAASAVLTPLGYVQISYSATAAVLSDRKQHPYFMRVCTPDDKQAKSMIRLIKELKNSNYIQVLYSEGAYGEGGRDAMRKEAKKHKICIADEISVAEGKYNGILDTLRIHAYAKIVVAFLQSYMAEEIVSEIEERMDFGEFMFIGSEAWGVTPEVIAERPKLAGSFTLSLEMADIPEFPKYVNSLDPATYKNNPWLKTYIEHKYRCYVSGSFNKVPKSQCLDDLRLASAPSFQQEQWTSFAINAVLALILGANKTMSELCGTTATTLCEDFRRKPDVLWNNIVQQKLDTFGIGRKIAVFDEKGDGNAGYKIYNIQRSKEDSQVLIYVEVGQAPLDEKEFVLKKDLIKYAESINLPSVYPNQYTYDQCFGDQNKTMTIESHTFITEYRAFAVLFGFLCLISLILVIFIIRLKRQKPVTKGGISDPMYLHPAFRDSDHYDSMEQVSRKNDYKFELAKPNENTVQ